MRDGTGILQCVVFKKDVTPEVFELADQLTPGVVADRRTRRGARRRARAARLRARRHAVSSWSCRAEEYPITPKEHGTAFLLDHRHLWLRSARQHAHPAHPQRGRCAPAATTSTTAASLLVDSPIFTPAACEGTTTLFETAYFGEKAYLTQSGQLYIEAGAMAFGKVYCFGPTFRAEKSKTRRHLTEFWMVEPEVAFMDLDGDMDLAEDFVEFVVQRVARDAGAASSRPSSAT